MKKLLLSIIVIGISLKGFSQSFKLPEGFTEGKVIENTEIKSQGMTGTCWSFSTSSFLESEVLRLKGKSFDLSEMFTVRNIYLEKAKNYVRYHGKANFSQGSLAHDVLYSYQKYGMMPESIYSGMVDSVHNHQMMEKELKSYLDSIIGSDSIPPLWQVAFTEIMDKHIGAPKPMFTYEGALYTPHTFAKKHLSLNISDYIGITSFTHIPFNKYSNLKLPDNFSDGQYYNVPLTDFMNVLDAAIQNGYSIEWDGDVSEKTFQARKGFATYPTNYTNITQELRQIEFDNYKTTDDHLMHIVGKTTDSTGTVYYIVKNSWGNTLGINGYMLLSKSYMAMKTVSIFVHKDALPTSWKVQN